MPRTARLLRILLVALVSACSGGAPSAPSVHGLGRIAFAEAVPQPVTGSVQTYGGSQLSVIDARGTNLRTLTPATSYLASYEWSPRARRVAYRLDDDPRVHVATEDGTVIASLATASELMPRGGDYRLSPDGTRLTYVTASPDGSRLWIQSVTGGVATVLARNDYGIGFGTWSRDGSWIAFASSGAVWRIRPDGTGLSRIAELESISYYAWSEDGRQLAIVAANGTWVVGADGANLRQVTGSGRVVPNFTEPRWSPDGRRLLGRSGENGGGDILVVRVNDGAQETRLTQPASSGDWSPDGSRIVYVKLTTRQLVTVAADGTGEEVVRDGPIGRPQWLP